MNGPDTDQIAHALVNHAPRRDAIKTVAGSGAAALAAWLGFGDVAARNKKKRCRKRRQSCGGRKKCCGANTACREFPTITCSSLSGRRCCGLEGAPCDKPMIGDSCVCCDGLFCGGPVGAQQRCQEEVV